MPIDENGNITDDNRIKQFIPSLKAIIEKGGKAIIMSHLGSPGGKFVSSDSLKPCALKLAELSGYSVQLAHNCVGDESLSLANNLSEKQVLLLENLRFHPGEEENDPSFAGELAKFGDIFVNDAFATAHRKHASMVGVPKLFKEKAPGLLMELEIKAFDKAMIKPKRPLCFILGGSKVSTKLNILNNIASLADKLIIGGAMANTFLAAQGFQVGRSLYERDLIGKALEILGNLARRETKVYLPVDLIVAPSFDSIGLGRGVPVQEIPADQMALDIGPASTILFKQALNNVETVVWNGPLGAFEKEEFANGTHQMIEAIATSHATSIVGGGDTDAAIHQMQLAHKFSHISTGGGAFLQLLEGKGLPGFSALE